MKPEERLAELLTSSRWTVAVAESCTGGALGNRITSVPGSSAYFLGGVTAYSDSAKSEVLGVPLDCLRNHGSVSAKTAAAMAAGVMDLFRADFGLAVTGVAGPGGGSAKKPVGTVFLALVHEEEELVKELKLTGTREEIRCAAAEQALKLACEFVVKQSA